MPDRQVLGLQALLLAAGKPVVTSQLWRVLEQVTPVEDAVDA